MFSGVLACGWSVNSSLIILQLCEISRLVLNVKGIVTVHNKLARRAGKEGGGGGGVGGKNTEKDVFE